MARDAENAPYRVRPSAVRGLFVVEGRQVTDNPKNTYMIVLFLGTKREAEVVAEALNGLARDIARRDRR